MNHDSKLSSIVAILAVLMPVLSDADVDDRARGLAAKLRYSLDRGSTVELQEIAARTSGRDLSRALGSPDRRVVLAAIAATRGAVDGWVQLAPLAELANGPDRPVAATAAASAAEIAARVDVRLLDEREVTSAELGERIRLYAELAAAEHRWADVRVHALEVSARLAALSPDTALGYDLETMAGDADPEVRRAAFELLPLPLPEGARDIAAGAVARDAEPLVAVAAAQSICSELGSEAPFQPILSALGQAGIERIRRLVVDPTLPPAALLDSARCLAADASPKSRRALQTLQKTGPRAIRRLVARIVTTKK